MMRPKGGFVADVVWDKDDDRYDREMKAKGVVLPGRVPAGQEMGQHMKENETKLLDIICQEQRF